MNPEEEDVLMNRFLSKQRPSLSDASQGSLRHSMESVLSPMDTGVRVDFRLADIGPREQERGRSYLDAPVSRGDYEMAHVNLPRPSQSSRPPPRDEPSHYFPRSSLQQKPGEDVLVHSEYTPIENIQPSPLLASRSQPPRPISTRNVESIELDFLSQINNMPNMEPSSMNQVLGAVKKQSDTIRKLQQAITDLEAARQQTPSSPPKWADLKRTLASKSNYAEVEDLRSKIKGLEDQLQNISKKEIEKKTIRVENPASMKEMLKMFESDSSAEIGTGLDDKLQEITAKLERSMTDHVQTLLQKSVDHLRTDLKSDLYHLLGSTGIPKTNTAGQSQYFGAHNAESNELGKMREILMDLQSRCSSIEGRLSGSPGRDFDSRPSRQHYDNPPTMRQKLSTLEQSLTKVLKEVEVIKSEITQNKKAGHEFAKGDLEKFKSKVLKDTKVVATRLDEVSALAQECRRLVSDVSQKEAQHGADMTKVLKEISSIKAQLAERKTSEIELRTRLESVSSDGGRVKDKISDVLEFEQRVQKRLDIHVVTLENLRQEIKTLKEDQKSKFEHSPIAIAGVKADLLEDILRIEKDLEQKVDTAVVEELMRHLATRDEVSNILKNVSRELTSENRINESYRTDLSEHILNNVREHMDALGNTISSTLYDKLSHDLHDEIRQFERDISTSRPSKENRTESHKSEKFMSEIGALRSKLDRHMHAVQGEITRISKTLDKRRDIEIPSPVSDSPSLSEARHVDLDIATSDKLVKAISESLARDFDEKFFLLCADLSACKAAYQAAASQPFFKCGQWLWRSNQLRQGSSIPWNYETVNTDPDNFRWEQDQTFIRVAEAGLYEITFAFFTQSRPSIQLVVNGESVLSAINSPTYVVHHGSGFVNDGGGKIEPGSITGISLIDFLALPAKSIISLHFHSSKKNQACHGFLGLKRL